MLIPAKPIPAFYCVYVLRSTIRHASLYIGSTPHPPRRLKQHNGEVKGGARKTSRRDYRPWEMITLVSGFPSAVAALKFEWALNNAHLTLHIPAEARLAVPTKRKRGGRPGRPRRTLSSIVANIHLLVGVASFARWPLNVHFFAREALLEWEDRMRCSETPARPGLRVLTDFSSAAAGARGGEGEEEEEQEEEEDAAPAGGIHDLTLDYGDIGGYVEKANEAVAFERAGRCVHCGGELANGQGLYPMCSHEGCEATGHLDCWSRHALRSAGDGDGDGDEVLLPNECECPSCGSTNRWGDMMKELSLRVRGGDVVEKLVKRRQRARKKAKAAAAA